MNNLEITREAKGVKREGFNKRELTLFRHSELGSESIPRRKLTVLAGKILKPSWIMRLCPKAWFWASYGFRFAHPTANPLQDDSYDNTHNELLTPHASPLTKSAFTMAEILLSLTIIGVVAAITLPSLTGNINERTWNTQRKALYSRMSQAISLLPTINGYGSTNENAAETFITSGLAKVLKINNICNNDNLYDCGFASEIINADATKISLPKEMKSLNAGAINANSPVSIRNTKAAAFETANGESVLTFYNPNCTASNVLVYSPAEAGLHVAGDVVKQHLCLNFIYDLNGKKGPNTVGKDIGNISVLYSSDPKVVMPMYPKALAESHTFAETVSACHELDEGQYRMPNLEEVLSVYYSRNIYPSAFPDTDTWSGTSIDATHAWAIGYYYGIRYNKPKTANLRGFCVQR